MNKQWVNPFKLKKETLLKICKWYFYISDLYYGISKFYKILTTSSSFWYNTHL